MKEEPRVRLLLLGKADVLAHGYERPLAAEMDDEEPPARHGSAVPADDRRAWIGAVSPSLLSRMQERRGLRSRATRRPDLVQRERGESAARPLASSRRQVSSA
jgi:hypothetical protein